MGGLFTKPPAPAVKPAAPMIDYAAAKFDASYVQQLQQQSAAAVAAANRAAEEQAKKLAGASYKTILYIVYTVLGMAVVGLIAALIHDLIVGPSGARILLPITPAGSGTTDQTLYINSAKYGNGSTTVDVSTYLTSKIVDSVALPGFVVSAANVGLGQDPVPGVTNTLYVTWYIGTGDYQQTTINSGDQFPTLPTGPAVSSSAPKAPPPSGFSSFFASITGGGSSSGDLLGSSHDASTSLSVAGTSAPLSDQGDGAYGMQWWMFVKDWNYGFGKKKSVVKRPDATNSSVLNPHISLHPTDNTLQVSVSLFPSSEGSTGKAVPAPAGHSSSTDDVFVCEVPNIPLQSWFSVSVSVFGRNLDIYIDGKLVKSCFLPGVPKPAVGDIQMTPDGGFSGQMCGFNHYPRMLTPGDAMNFWSAGSSCQSSSPGSTPTSKATGYSVKFGVYDSVGKQVQEYSF